jgi:hypothetical protein
MTSYKDFFPKFSTTKAPMSPLRSPQRVELLSTLKHPRTITKIKSVSLLSIPMKRRGIQTSRDSTTHFGVSGQHLAITREMNAIEVIDEDAEVLLLELKGLTQRLAPIFSLGLRIE